MPTLEEYERIWNEQLREYDQWQEDRELNRLIRSGLRLEDAYLQMAMNEAAENQYYEYELSRGDLAFVPEIMFCFDCGILSLEGFKTDAWGFQYVERKVVALGPVVDRADPTQTYDLECGHRTIAM